MVQYWDRGFAFELCSRFASSLKHSVHSGQDSLVRSLASQLHGICAMGIALIKCTSCLSHEDSGWLAKSLLLKQGCGPLQGAGRERTAQDLKGTERTYRMVAFLPPTCGSETGTVSSVALIAELKQTLRSSDPTLHYPFSAHLSVCVTASSQQDGSK